MKNWFLCIYILLCGCGDDLSTIRKGPFLPRIGEREELDISKPKELIVKKYDKIDLYCFYNVWLSNDSDFPPIDAKQSSIKLNLLEEIPTNISLEINNGETHKTVYVVQLEELLILESLTFTNPFEEVFKAVFTPRLILKINKNTTYKNISDGFSTEITDYSINIHEKQETLNQYISTKNSEDPLEQMDYFSCFLDTQEKPEYEQHFTQIKKI